MADAARRAQRCFDPHQRRKNSAALAELTKQHPGVSWIDRKSGYDSLFSFWRTLPSGLLALALLLITLSFVLRLGLKAGLRSALPSVLSLAMALATLGWIGASLNLFALLALILVLGIGINYTLFFSNPQGTPLTSLLAVSLAMITTLLTLGMLVFSSTSAHCQFWHSVMQRHLQRFPAVAAGDATHPIKE